MLRSCSCTVRLCTAIACSWRVFPFASVCFRSCKKIIHVKWFFDELTTWHTFWCTHLFREELFIATLGTQSFNYHAVADSLLIGAWWPWAAWLKCIVASLHETVHCLKKQGIISPYFILNYILMSVWFSEPSSTSKGGFPIVSREKLVMWKLSRGRGSARRYRTRYL